METLTKTQIKDQLKVLSERIGRYENYLFGGGSHPLTFPCCCCGIPSDIAYKQSLSSYCEACILSEFDPISIDYRNCITPARYVLGKCFNLFYSNDLESYTEYRLLELICLRDYWEERIK